MIFKTIHSNATVVNFHDDFLPKDKKENENRRKQVDKIINQISRNVKKQKGKST